jgi:hypothetical protein
VTTLAGGGGGRKTRDSTVAFEDDIKELAVADAHRLPPLHPHPGVAALAASPLPTPLAPAAWLGGSRGGAGAGAGVGGESREGSRGGGASQGSLAGGISRGSLAGGDSRSSLAGGGSRGSLAGGGSRGSLAGGLGTGTGSLLPPIPGRRLPSRGALATPAHFIPNIPSRQKHVKMLNAADYEEAGAALLKAMDISPDPRWGGAR